MSGKERLREDLDEKMAPKDRRTIQPKGEIEIADLDGDELAHLRDEDITNINENELTMLDAQVGVTRRTDEGSDLLPLDKLDRDLADEEKE